MSLNMDSILSKAKAAIQPGGQAYDRYQTTVKKIKLGTIKLQSGAIVHTPEEAAAKFMEVLRHSIESSGISANAQNAISDLSYTSPTEMSDGTYFINVYFSGDLSRPSLYPEKYGGLNDLAEMLNDGMHAKDYVYGTWHGERIRSKTVFPGTGFMNQAVEDFKRNYGTEYGVISCTLNK